MSASNNRSEMFKSKSGRHFITNKGDEREDRQRIRHEERHKVYLRNRVIQPATIDTGESKSIKINVHDEDLGDLRIPQKLNQNSNRQQQFREKFKKYLYKKANNQQSKAKVTPFFSAVAKGRFIDIEKLKNVEIKKKSVIPKIETPKFEIPKFSPIVTRSKRIAILPAASTRLQTTKQKDSNKKETSRVTKYEDEPENKIPIVLTERPFIKVKRTLASCNNKLDKPNMSKTLNTGALKKAKTLQSKSSQTENFSTLQRGTEKPKKLESKINDPATTIKSFVTSTVAKPKNARSLTKPKKSTVIFNESISPIEEVSLSGISYERPLMNIRPSLVNSIKENENSNTSIDSNSSKTTALNYVSPFVTISRGSRTSTRKEKSARDSKYILESRKSLDLNQSVEQRQNHEAACYFRLQVQRETERFNGLVMSWREYANDNINNVPSESIDLINVTIGQTQLLITSKFKQFINLVSQCENDESKEIVRPEDLEGFWSMVYLQVENCNQRFERLEKLRTNNWEDPEINIAKQKKLRPNNSMVTKHKTKTTKKYNSALANILKEARKNYNKPKEISGQDDLIFIGNSRKTLNTTPRLKITRSKHNVWTVEKSGIKEDPFKVVTAVRGILKTPNSVSKKRLTLKFKSSPQIKLFEEEN